MVSLAGAFGRFAPFSVLVLGDFMLDTYTTGRVKRISPEAPVPVMEVLRQEVRPGGAGNVVLNLLSLGGKVFAGGRIGEDKEGEALKEALRADGADLSPLLVQKGYRTPLKNRLIAGNQQLLRVDFEEVTPLPSDFEEEFLVKCKALMREVDVIAVSDYGKGFLTNSLLQSVFQMAKKANVPVIVDPKGLDFTKYAGASVLKPNLSEAYAAAKLPLGTSLDEVAAQILRYVPVDRLLITRSEAGMSLFSSKGERADFPVRSKEVIDVTGAGDTVLAVLCLALASGLDLILGVQFANIAAGIAIERLGCVQVTLSALAERLLEYDRDTKVFDESHTYALHKVLEGKRYSLLALEKGQEMTTSLFKTIRNLSKPDEALIVYVSDSHPDDDFVHLLSSLQEVDTIVLQSESLKHLCKAIHPQETYLFQKDQAVQAKSIIASLLNSYY